MRTTITLDDDLAVSWSGTGKGPGRASGRPSTRRSGLASAS
ncbi:MAG TPA: hypothetical protein VKV38_08490 [Trebonia sp.]|nr:hypothetical protein [Trebonia sp.]